MSSTAEQIKERLSINDVIGSYIKIEKAGGNYKARCPFHNEKTPSFFISPGRNSYYCFGCGAKGDIFTFVQEFEKVDFLGALKLLAEKAGVSIERFQKEDQSEANRLRAVIEQATVFYEKQLADNKEAVRYLMDRGLTEKTIGEWRIGYAPNDWRQLYDNLLARKISASDMETVGLIKKPEDTPNATPYDRFRARVMFPLIDPSKRVVGYSGRLWGVPDTDGPKYLNSPETPLFTKSDFLYGYHKAKEGIREWRYAVLVEGQMDLLMCHQAGFTNAVATSGTALTNAHLEKIRKISNNLMIVYDADKAGLKATLRAWTSALELGMDVKIAGLPAGEDPASLILQDVEKFKTALKASKHIIEYYLDILTREEKDQRSLWKLVASELVPYIEALPSAIDRGHFISLVSLKSGIGEEDLRAEVENYTKFKKNEKPVGGASASSSSSSGFAANAGKFGGTVGTGFEKTFMQESIMDQLVGLALMQKEKSPEVAGLIEKSVRRIFETHFDPDDAARSVASFTDRLQEAPPDLAFKAEVLYAGSTTLERDVEDLEHELEERVLKEKFSRLMRELQQADKKGDKDASMNILKQCQEVSHALATLQKQKRI